MTWLAALQAVTSRCGGQPGELAVIGLEAFTALVRDALPGWGGQRIHGPVCKTRPRSPTRRATSSIW
jgi:hypothetical protein